MTATAATLRIHGFERSKGLGEVCIKSWRGLPDGRSRSIRAEGGNRRIGKATRTQCPWQALSSRRTARLLRDGFGYYPGAEATEKVLERILPEYCPLPAFRRFWALLAQSAWTFTSGYVLATTCPSRGGHLKQHSRFESRLGGSARGRRGTEWTGGSDAPPDLNSLQTQFVAKKRASKPTKSGGKA